MTNKAYAIILAGGNGERFWPVSTPSNPKQFLTLFDGKALIRHAVDRLDGVIPAERILIITAQRLVAKTRKILPMIPATNIIGEPCRRDTAPAVTLACALVKRLGGDEAVGCILTADQLINPVAKFKQTLKDAIKVAMTSESIVTMGIAPTRPATDFGYIECGKKSPTKTKTAFYTAQRFVEKPNARMAASYLKSGNFLWNAGMFIWRASVMEKALETHAPKLASLIDLVAKAKNISTILKKVYPALQAISIDYAVMEKSKNILVAKSDFNWDDVGAWTSLANHFAADKLGNIAIGRTANLDTTNSIIVSEGSHLIATIGVKNMVVVHTPKATLVCPKERVSDIKKLLKEGK